MSTPFFGVSLGVVSEILSGMFRKKEKNELSSGFSNGNDSQTTTMIMRRSFFSCVTAVVKKRTRSVHISIIISNATNLCALCACRLLFVYLRGTWMLASSSYVFA